METARYCTPEWLEACAKGYPEKPRFAEEFQKLIMVVCFRVNAEPAWGIEKDILFGAQIDKGQLLKLVFYSKDEAYKDADFILTATPQEWKKILRKENKFLTDFMLGKILLEKGSKVKVVSLAPHSTTLVDVLTQVPLQFQDEMTPEELEAYRAYSREFRQRLGV